MIRGGRSSPDRETGNIDPGEEPVHGVDRAEAGDISGDDHGVGMQVEEVLDLAEVSVEIRDQEDIHHTLLVFGRRLQNLNPDRRAIRVSFPSSEAAQASSCRGHEGPGRMLRERSPGERRNRWA